MPYHFKLLFRSDVYHWLNKVYENWESFIFLDYHLKKFDVIWMIWIFTFRLRTAMNFKTMLASVIREYQIVPLGCFIITPWAIRGSWRKRIILMFCPSWSQMSSPVYNEDVPGLLIQKWEDLVTTDALQYRCAKQQQCQQPTRLVL